MKKRQLLMLLFILAMGLSQLTAYRTVCNMVTGLGAIVQKSPHACCSRSSESDYASGSSSEPQDDCNVCRYEATPYRTVQESLLKAARLGPELMAPLSADIISQDTVRKQDLSYINNTYITPHKPRLSEIPLRP